MGGPGGSAHPSGRRRTAAHSGGLVHAPLHVVRALEAYQLGCICILNVATICARSRPVPEGSSELPRDKCVCIREATAELVRRKNGTSHSSGRVHWGHVKAFHDGSLGSRTAFMHEPYEDQPGNAGMRVTPLEQLRAMAGQADAAELHVRRYPSLVACLFNMLLPSVHACPWDATLVYMVHISINSTCL